MEFYIVLQDQTSFDYPEPTGILNTLGRNILKDVDNGFESKPTVFYIKEKPDIRYPDFIQNPIPLVSDKFKRIIGEYQCETLFKPIVLADKKRMHQHLYWIAAPGRTDIISSRTEFNKDGSVKRLVIDVSYFFRKNVFMLDGIVENFLVISLEVAERLLRENFDGIILKKIEKEGE